jgi:hypothetical protein
MIATSSSKFYNMLSCISLYSLPPDSNTTFLCELMVLFLCDIPFLLFQLMLASCVPYLICPSLLPTSVADHNPSWNSFILLFYHQFSISQFPNLNTWGVFSLLLWGSPISTKMSHNTSLCCFAHSSSAIILIFFIYFRCSLRTIT